MKKIVSILTSSVLIISSFLTVFSEGDAETGFSVEIMPVEVNNVFANITDEISENVTEEASQEDDMGEITEVQDEEIIEFDLDEVNDDIWTTSHSITEGRAGFSTAAINGDLYVIGGYNNDGCVNTILKFDDNTELWTTVTTIPTTTYGYSVVTLNEKIYIIGGYTNNTYLNTVQVYNTNTGIWTNETPMIERREEAASLIADNKIYVFGGRNADGIVNSYEYFDITNNSWHKVTTGFAESVIRIGAKAKYINGFVCIYGGVNKNCSYMGVNVYSADDLSTSVASCASGKEHVTVAWGADKGMIFSAAERASNYVVNELVVEENSAYINDVTSMTTPANNLYMEFTIYGGYLYCLGGYSSSSKAYTSDTYIYSVYYGDYSLSDGAINSLITAGGNTLTFNADTGKNYILMFNVNNIDTFNGYTFSIDYPEDGFGLFDGCAMTPDRDIYTGQINGTNITLTKNTSKEVSFICNEYVSNGKKITKTVNAIILRAKSSGQRTISYSMTK